MGLSSSQARWLTLTSRMHDIEYKAAKLEAQKLQMANESRKAYDDYLVALDATKIQMKIINTDGSLNYVDATSSTVRHVTESELHNLQNNGVLPGGTKEYTYEIYKDDTTWLTNLINEGLVIIQKRDNSGNYYDISVATDTGLQEVSDEKDLRKAEAKYEADMKKIDMKDRRYDTQLAALDNERNAIKSEMETLKTVAKDNVERTFKLFS